MSIVIEKGIPIPARKGGPDGLCSLLRQMEDGDSFTAPPEKRKVVHSAATYVGIKIAVRRQCDGLIRVWKIGERAKRAASTEGVIA